MHRPLVAAMAASLAASVAFAGGAANVEIKAQVAAACSVAIVGPISEVTFNPLLLHASVQENCNGTHSLTVTYSPSTLSNPSSLVLTFNGAPPTSMAPGIVTFANLPMTNATKLLTIAYSGPPPERTSIKNTVAIGVSVP